MKRIVFVFGLIMASLGLQAQSTWGSSVADSVKCYENYNIMGSYYQTKNYVEAYPSWLELYQVCPGANENIYKFGDNILAAKISEAKSAKDEAAQAEYIKMMIHLFDDWNTYFPGNEAEALSAKAYNHYKYYKGNADSVSASVELYKQAYAVAGNDMDVAHINYYFLSNIKDFNKTKDVDRLFEVYNNALQALEYNYNKINIESFALEAQADSVKIFMAEADSLAPFAATITARRDSVAAFKAAEAASKKKKKKKKGEPEVAEVAPVNDPAEDDIIAKVERAEELKTKYKIDEDGYTVVDRRKISNNEILLRNIDKVQSNIEKALSPLLTCDKLAVIYSEDKFEANKTDVDWLKRAARMLQKERKGDDGEMSSCVDNPVFLLVAETLYQLEPSAAAARSMARLGVQQQDWSMAKKYFQEAIDQEEDLRKKADDYMGLALVDNKIGAYASAKSDCLKAAQLRKEWGNPYLFLATIYGKAAEDGVWGKNAVEKKAAYWAAINKLSYAASIDPDIASKANKLSSMYKQAVPDKSIAFQLGAKEGDVIKIGSWINETVTVKFY